MTSNSKNNIIKVAIADDHALFKKGIKLALSMYRDIEIIMEADNGSDLLNKLKMMQPDIILLDLQMPIIDGATVLPVIRDNYPGIKIIILSLNSNDILIPQLLDLWASSFLTKTDEPAVMYKKITDSYYNK